MIAPNSKLSYGQESTFILINVSPLFLSMYHRQVHLSIYNLKEAPKANEINGVVVNAMFPLFRSAILSEKLTRKQVIIIWATKS